MAFLGLYLCYIILSLFLIIYLKLIFKCKRAVKVSVEVLKQIESSKIKSHHVELKADVLVQPPGPLPLPVLGNLALLGKYECPFEGFSALSKVYGDVYSLSLGSNRCVVVNDLETIREVLNQNGKFFGGRPNFEVSENYAVCFYFLLLWSRSCCCWVGEKPLGMKFLRCDAIEIFISSFIKFK